MNIGIFDSGLGGLHIAKSIIGRLPQYGYVYLGDTKRVPYGNRTDATIYQFTKECIDYLFAKGCVLIIVACNTASARALRKLQRTYLVHHYPERRVLGMIIPTVETVVEHRYQRIGIIATNNTVSSKKFIKEFEKAAPRVKVFQQATPLLVPLIEQGGKQWVPSVAAHYLKPLLKKRIDALILGCTHYSVIKYNIKKIVGKNVSVISQDDVVPKKLVGYLKRHPEIEKKITRNRQRTFFVTELTPYLKKTSKAWFGKKIQLKKVNVV